MDKNFFDKIIQAHCIDTHKYTIQLYTAIFDTPLGRMIAISDNTALRLLKFIDQVGLESEVKKLCITANAVFTHGTTSPIESIKEELASYFVGNLKVFSTPLFFKGTDFQEGAWDVLCHVPYGETRSYADQAVRVGNPTAWRAVAHANAVNKIIIAIPCHRIINKNGNYGGYAGGVDRKKWLIDNEKRNK